MQTLTKSAPPVPGHPCMFTVPEVAWAAETENQFINAEVDRKIVQVQCDGRRLLADWDVLYFRTVREIGVALNVEWRKIIYTSLRQALASGNRRKIHHGPFSLNIWKVLQEIDERTAEIQAAKNAVHSLPGVRGGEPVIKGTRIPVRLVGKLTRGGLSLSDFAQEYDLNERQVELAALYDRLYPKRGRPSIDSSDGEWTDVNATYRENIEELGEYRKS